MSVELNKYAKDFLLFSYFGVTSKEIEDNKEDKAIIMLCAQRAYLDLNRTLTFCKEADGDGKSCIENRKQFRDEMCKLIVDGINDKLYKSTQKDFDDWHNGLCETLIEKATNHKCNQCNILIPRGKSKSNGKNENIRFSYGQAQKWLNMTLKYMWLLGFWKETKELHVPVDSYIIEATWGVKSVSLPLTEKSDRIKQYANPSEHVKAWSQWNEDDYTNFQKSLRESLDVSPIKWEGPAWIDIAQKRKNTKEQNNK